MLPKELKEILDRLAAQTDNIISDSQTDVKRLEKRLFSAVSDFVASLEKDKSGNIKPNKVNVKKLASLDRLLSDSVIDEKYLKDVNGFIKDLEATTKTMSEYFTKADLGFENDKAFRDVESAIVDPVYNSLTQEGLSQNVNNQIRKSITNGVVGNYPASQVLQELDDLINGNNERLGLMSRHVQQVATDATMQYTRTYFEVISSDLGLEYILYEGSAKDTTREFCQARHGKYYSREEVKSWASMSWSGKIPTTNESNIFVYCGGFQCRHMIIPVSESVVPESVIKRTAIVD
jgi:hypothetical protein